MYIEASFTGLTRLEKALFQNLTAGYNPSSRPVTRAKEKVYMTFGIGLNQIIDLVCIRLIISFDC